jgi:hypothetical protein
MGRVVAAAVLPSPDCEGLPLGERARDALIGLWSWVSGKGRALLRPGAGLTGLAVAVFGVANIVKSQGPSAELWKAGEWGAWLLIVSGTFATLGYFLVTWGYSRRLMTEESEAALYKTCRSIARAVSQTTKINQDRVGVHVWAVAGPPGLRHLVRRVKYGSVVVERPESGVTWRRGRGALGICWRTETQDVWDLEDLQSRAPTRQAFCVSLTPDERMGLTWSEFSNTKHYTAVWVQPIFKSGGGSRITGCLSVDIVEVPGAAEKLTRAVKKHSIEFLSHRSVLQDRLK